jgi:BirA family biotin operon repressor/biotin-[acetyl-CoA-carboxylase] ligase
MGAVGLRQYDGVAHDELAVRLGVKRCLALESVASTLDVVHELAAAGAPDGTVVLADEQTAGRGRRGRSWQSPAGTGIWLGFLARPRAESERGVLALRVGLAVVESLEELGVQASLKWPNDVVVSDRKLGGVLCEARWAEGRAKWVAIGIGLNVHRPLPPELTGRAIALDEVAAGATRLQVLERLAPRLGSLRDAPSLDDAELAAFERHDWLRGRVLEAPVAGTARGIDSDGALLVETETGVERILGGSVATA